MTYKQKAKKQNMDIERAKAIDILEYIEGKCNLDLAGMFWYELEDKVTNIIKEK